jgi:hypothetical protein
MVQQSTKTTRFCGSIDAVTWIMFKTVILCHYGYREEVHELRDFSLPVRIIFVFEVVHITADILVSRVRRFSFLSFFHRNQFAGVLDDELALYETSCSYYTASFTFKMSYLQKKKIHE